MASSPVETDGEKDQMARSLGAMEKSRYVRVIEAEEVRRDDLIKYFLPTRVRITFCVPEGVMAIEVPQNEEICGGGRSRFCHPSEKSE